MIDVAADCAREILGTMGELQLEAEGRCCSPDPEVADAAGCIAMMTPTGGWNLAVSATQQSCRLLAASLLGLEDDEPIEPEMVSDALGEIVNLLAGAIKSAQANPSGWRLGLPMYVEGNGWFLRAPTGSQFAAQRLAGCGVVLQLIICWREG